MCTECADAVQQKLYCVHADRIAAEDHALAVANGAAYGQRLPPIRSRRTSSLARRRDEIADELW
eukprot:198944-Rhodomonas_salina.1